MLPPSPLTEPDVQISSFLFFTGELRSQRCSDGRSGLTEIDEDLASHSRNPWQASTNSSSGNVGQSSAFRSHALQSENMAALGPFATNFGELEYPPGPVLSVNGSKFGTLVVPAASWSAFAREEYDHERSGQYRLVGSQADPLE
jgi:hypothetical protein